MVPLLIIAAIVFAVGFVWRLLDPVDMVGCLLFFGGILLALIAVLGRAVGFL